MDDYWHMKKKIHIKTIGGEETVKDEIQKDKLNEGKKFYQNLLMPRKLKQLL